MRYIFLAASMFLAVGGQLLLKKGVLASSLSADLGSILKTLFSPLIFLGLTAYGVSAVVWLFVLQKFPLSVAYPALSLTYIAIVFISIYLFKEPFTTFKILGVFLIIIGVYFLFK
jgi:multidrug transporter EmrE-like cation transporter